MYDNPYGAFGLGTDSHGRRVGANPRYNAQQLGLASTDQLGMAQGDYMRTLEGQNDALGMYANAAAGNGPTAAQSMLQQAGEQNQARAVALAHQTRGGNVAGANRAALAAGMGMQAQTQQQMAQLRAQEQQAAMQGYAGLGMQMGAQAQQQQAMHLGAQQNLLGMQFGDDAHRREAAQRAREARTQRNLAWSQYGTGVAGSVLGALGGG